MAINRVPGSPVISVVMRLAQDQLVGMRGLSVGKCQAGGGVQDAVAQPLGVRDGQ